MNTLLLDASWDLTLDASGNIAVATGPYALAQDVASAVRTFQSEVWYDFTFGVPYLQRIFNQTPPQAPPSLQFMKAKYIAVGLTVPGVQSIKCFLTGPDSSRRVGGQLQITDNDGTMLPLVMSPELGVSPWYVSAVSA